MAIYHLSAKMISRSKGRSSVAAAAYRSGSRLHDQRTGEDHDYTRKRGVEHSEIVAPDNAPAWMRDRASLWNAVERIERRRDAQLAREIELGLPREVEIERRTDLVRSFIQSEFVDHGMIADFAMHNGRARDGGEQPHAHVMLTTRELMGEGFGKKAREWNETDRLEGWRARWAQHVNRELERGGHSARVDHRSLDVQRAEAERAAERAREAGDEREADKQNTRAATLDREPEPKLGPIASQMEKLGHASRRGDERRAAEARNAQRRALHEQARELARQIAEVAQQVADDARRRLQGLAQRLEAAYRRARLGAHVALAPSESMRLDTDEVAPAQNIAQTTRDLLLGRANRPADNLAKVLDPDALLGRKAGARSDKSSTRDPAALLDQTDPRPITPGDRSRDDDRGR